MHAGGGGRAHFDPGPCRSQPLGRRRAEIGMRAVASDKACSHFRLAKLVVCDAPSRRERLQPLTAVEARLWRVEDEPIAGVETLQSSSLAVPSLREPTLDPHLDMISTDRVHPILHRDAHPSDPRDLRNLETCDDASPGCSRGDQELERRRRALRYRSKCA